MKYQESIDAAEYNVQRAPYLDGSRVALQSDDLADQVVSSYANELVHGGSSHAISNDDLRTNISLALVVTK